MWKIICKRCGISEFRRTPNVLYCLNCASEINKEDARKRWRENIVMPKTRCYFCGIKENLHIHHIDKNEKNNLLKNLMCVCMTCHKKLHTKIYKKIYGNRITT